MKFSKLYNGSLSELNELINTMKEQKVNKITCIKDLYDHPKVEVVDKELEGSPRKKYTDINKYYDNLNSMLSMERCKKIKLQLPYRINYLEIKDCFGELLLWQTVTHVVWQ